MTQAELSERSLVSTSALCRIERGDRPIKSSEVDVLARALDFPPKFFSLPIKQLDASGEVHFRKKSATLASARKQVVAELNLASSLAHELQGSADVSVDSDAEFVAGTLEEYNDSPEFAAYAIRKQLRLPPGSVRNLTESIESAGVFVFLYDMGADVFGASHWPSNRPPVICMNSSIPGDRYRWTLAHEVGHLILHSVEADLSAMERQADRFASELLMPADDIASSLRGLTVSKLRRLKHEWGVSMQALLMRARSLGCLSEYEFKRHMMTFSRKGWRKREPEPLPKESPTVVQSSRRAMAESYRSATALAESLGFPPDILAKLTSISSGPTFRHLRAVQDDRPSLSAGIQPRDARKP